MLVADLEPHIHVILSAPGTDLSTISAKRVRRILLEQNNVPPDLIKNNKEDVDALISVIFAKVSEEKGFAQDSEAGAGDDREESPAPSAASKKRRRASRLDEEDEPSAKATKPSTAGDEALARQLSDEINGRSRASRSSAGFRRVFDARNPRARSWTGSRDAGEVGRANGARSADTIDDSGNEGSDGDESKKRKGGGLSKAYNLSEPLAALVQEESLSRPQVVKRLWAYIKSNKLQNPSNGREILCDDALRAVFNTDKIDMFKMNKELGK
ncbi:hypothetical protein EDB83DRAFT_2226539 [Lactarius deliciosus]|nr:hypothetical protein EDB83DRAFT_2226539 [Lactarius deliciosus]